MLKQKLINEYVITYLKQKQKEGYTPGTYLYAEMYDIHEYTTVQLLAFGLADAVPFISIDEDKNASLYLKIETAGRVIQKDQTNTSILISQEYFGDFREDVLQGKIIEHFEKTLSPETVKITIANLDALFQLSSLAVAV